MEGFEKQIERLMELTAYQVFVENSRIMGQQRRAFKIVDHKVHESYPNKIKYLANQSG